MKAYKVNISGTYRTGGGDFIDYQNITGHVPFGDMEFTEAMVRARYALMWLTMSPKYKERITSVREVYIDSIEGMDEAGRDIEHDFSFIGKDIVKMTYEELQDLAVAKDLRSIPLYKKGGLRQAQNVAYAAYASTVLGVHVEHKEAGFNAASQQAIRADGFAMSNPVTTFTNEEIIQREMDSVNAKGASEADYSRAQLESLASQRGISFHPSIADKNLYTKIFNSGDK